MKTSDQVGDSVDVPSIYGYGGMLGRVRSIIGSGSAVGFARTFSLICAAIQLPLLTRLLSPAEYSAIAIAIVIATYFSLLSAEPVILGFERFPGSSLDRSNYRYAMTRAFIHVGVAGVLVTAVAFPFGLHQEAIAFVGWGLGIAANRLISLAWLMWQKPWHYAWNLSAGTGARTAVLIMLILLGWSPLVALGTAGIASAAAALILSPRIKFGFRHESGYRPWSRSFGIHLAVASLSYTILNNANLLVLAGFAPSNVIGTYAAMMQVATLTSGALLGLVLAVAYPPLLRAWTDGQQSRVRAHLSSMQLLCISIAAATVFACYIGDQYFLGLILTSDYIDPRVLAPLILSTAFATMGGMASWHHQLELRAGRVAIRTVLAAVAGTMLTVGLTALFREGGAALGSLLGFFLYLAIMQFGSKLPALTLIASAVTATIVCVPLVMSNGSGDSVLILSGIAACCALFGAFRAHSSTRRKVLVANESRTN